MNLENIRRQKEQFERESRDAGKRTFDLNADRLHYRDFYSMNQLEGEECNWEKMIECCGGEVTDWKNAAREFDCDAFASGFFERFQEFWEELGMRLSEQEAEEHGKK
jgi:hypothetical protein